MARAHVRGHDDPTFVMPTSSVGESVGARD
jgi:hypothetical protein